MDETSNELPFIQRAERWLAELSVRNNFWHRVFAFFFLPSAWRSGIAMRWTEGQLTPRMPFRRANRNWYGAMSGAALSGNAEIAGGLILNRRVGRDYTCVCKSLNYRFLRPCLGPAEYHLESLEGLEDGMASEREFNVDLKLRVFQVEKDANRIVGKAEITYHLAPKSLVKSSIFHPSGKRRRK
ncbi:MAG: hypothetical protein KDA80_02215 [Planctomycetaceae bacterium]|nr:hypothetical protein [Planctomycetaceae bacterium]